MPKDKDAREKSGKKAPEKTLKEKRAAKAAKREGKNNGGSIDLSPTLKGKHS